MWTSKESVVVRLSCAFCSALLTVFTFAVPAAAGTQQIEDHFSSQAEKHVARFAEIGDKLRQQTPETWTDHDIQAYLVNALWAVNSAVTLHSIRYSELPADPGSLVADGVLSSWPGNPFKDWMPMQVTAGEFSAGDFNYQVCPPQYYSLGSFSDVPLSYELGVFGPDIDFASRFGHAEPYKHNRAWAHVPEGPLYMLGGWAESATVARERYADPAYHEEEESK